MYVYICLQIHLCVYVYTFLLREKSYGKYYFNFFFHVI